MSTLSVFHKHLSFLHLLLVQAMCLWLLVENQDQQKLGTHHDDNGKAEEVEMESEVESLGVCALDPGVRTFQTVFDVDDGHALQVGDGGYESGVSAV